MCDVETNSNIKITIDHLFFENLTKIDQCSNWIEIAGNQAIMKIIIGLIFFLPTYGIILNYFLKRIK